MNETELLRANFLGYCQGTPDSGVPGHIRILGVLGKDESGIPVLQPGWQDSDLGPSGRVFWPAIQPYPKVSHNGRLVRLKLDKNPFYFGKDDPRKDWYQVAKRNRDSTWDLTILGHVVLEGSPDRVPDEEAWRHLPTNDQIYLRDTRAALLYGPYAIVTGDGAKILVPTGPSPSRLLQFEVEMLPRGGLVETPSGSLYLLGAPPPVWGEPVDTATPQQLAEWLDATLRRGLPAALEVLERELPDWRAQLKESIDNKAPLLARKLEQIRWSRLQEILDAVIQDGWNLELALLECPQLKQQVQRELDIIAALKPVEVQAEWMARDAEATAEDRPPECDLLQEEMEQELAELRRQIVEAQEDLEELRARRARLEDSASPLEAAREHLEQAHERLILDYSAFEALQRGSRSSPDPLLLPLGSIDECADPDAFVERKLYPLMFKQAQVFSLALARALHDALVCFRWTLVPHAGWSRSYQRALGNSCHMEILPVEASWLSFRQVWEDHVAPLWLGATKNPDRIFLIHFQDLDRSLPEHWCRPFWNLDMGIADRLHPTVPPGWPANLRFLASPAPDDRAIPLSPISLQHFAGVPLEAIGTRTPQADRVPGDIPASTWLGWTRPDDAPEPGPDLASFKYHLLDRLTAGTLPRERGGQNQMTKIWKPTLKAADVIARGLAPEERERTIQYLTKLRVEWPQSYVSFRGTDA